MKLIVIAIALAAVAAAGHAQMEQDPTRGLTEQQIQERSDRLQADARVQAEANEAARRALILQMLQSGAFQVKPNVIEPNLFPALRPSTTCTTERIGNQLQTVCR